MTQTHACPARVKEEKIHAGSANIQRCPSCAILVASSSVEAALVGVYALVAIRTSYTADALQKKNGVGFLA